MNIICQNTKQDEEILPLWPTMGLVYVWTSQQEADRSIGLKLFVNNNDICYKRLNHSH